MLRLGLIPSVDPQTMIDEAQPFVRSLWSMLGVGVEAVVPESYTAVGEGLLDGSIDIGFIGPAGYVIARDKLKAPIEPVARGVLDVGGSAWGKAIIVARSDAGIECIGDLRGMSFAFSDPLSTSGYFVPYRVLVEGGVKSGEDLATPAFTGSLGTSLRQVADGAVDAAGIGDEILALAVHRGELAEDAVSVIYESKAIPGSVFVVRTSLGSEFVERIRAAILGMQNMPFCKIGLISRMEPAGDSDYDIVRDHLKRFDACCSSDHE